MTKHQNQAFIDYLHQLLQQQGTLSFATFMENTLYHPTWGYYNAADFTLGKQGDFTTAPEISPLFAQCVAKQIQQILAAIPNSSLLELGAGTGRLASDLLHALHAEHQLPAHYYIVEISANLRKKQQAFLKETCPEWITRIHWLERIPTAFNGVVLANEVLDALPVHRFCVTPDGPQEQCVAWENERFIWQTQPLNPPLAEVVAALCQHSALPTGYCSEVNLAAVELVRHLAQALQQGVLLLIDYGYGQREYYHPQRTQGTLTCFYQHHKHADPLIHLGMQDITAHVDFTRVVETAVDEGCQLAGFTTQAAFLLSCGLLDCVAAQQHASQASEFLTHQAVKTLTLPTEMGEVVKVIALSKGIAASLVGFGLQDRRRDL